METECYQARHPYLFLSCSQGWDGTWKCQERLRAGRTLSSWLAWDPSSHLPVRGGSFPIVGNPQIQRSADMNPSCGSWAFQLMFLNLSFFQLTLELMFLTLGVSLRIKIHIWHSHCLSQICFPTFPGGPFLLHKDT